MEITATVALALVARANLKPFTSSDWSCFSGCESANPMVDYDVDMDDGSNCAVVVDGNKIIIVPGEDECGGYQFSVSAT